ncbi:MAG: isopenicillin N synthase family dioxygenase [Oceanicaulis sp.]
MSDTILSDQTLHPVSYRLAERDPDAFASALGASFRETGFAVVSDHPVDQAVIDRALADAKSFFALPEAAKRAYFDPQGGGQRGYTPFATENAKGFAAKDLKEFWHRGRDLPAGHRFADWMPANVSVSEIASFDASTKAMYEALDTMGATLLRAIAVDLGLREDWFETTVNEGNSVLRLLHYPPIEGEPNGVRAGAHEDINVITLLLGAEEAGLQVKTKSGAWLPIQPPEGALVVNIGDMLQRLTNHVLPSTTHRVVNPSAERMKYPRYSTPFFLHFNPDFEIRTLPGCVTSDNPDRYPEPITAHGYLHERLVEIGLVKA